MEGGFIKENKREENRSLKRLKITTYSGKVTSITFALFY
jgi:hypothetical protein